MKRYVVMAIAYYFTVLVITVIAFTMYFMGEEGRRYIVFPYILLMGVTIGTMSRLIKNEKDIEESGK